MNTIGNRASTFADSTPAQLARDFLERLAASMRARYQARAMRRELISLDDHVLRDIGVSRDDLRAELERLARSGRREKAS